MKNIHVLKVIDLQKEVDDYLSVYFAKPSGFDFSPGDCFDLRFNENDFRQGRIFSFSSSPTEEALRISFKKGISEYKKRLERVKPSDTLLLNHFGSQYEFYLDKPLVFYAGGVGIAVFRSIIKSAVDSGLSPSFTLINTNRTEEFLFRNELDEWGKSLSMPIHYLVTQMQGRLSHEYVTKFIPGIDEKQYIHYIVGPPAMVDATKKILLSLHVEGMNIHTDSFDGYWEES